MNQLDCFQVMFRLAQIGLSRDVQQCPWFVRSFWLDGMCLLVRDMPLGPAQTKFLTPKENKPPKALFCDDLIEPYEL